VAFASRRLTARGRRAGSGLPPHALQLQDNAFASHEFLGLHFGSEMLGQRQVFVRLWVWR
jgi:hypothetical protein